MRAAVLTAPGRMRLARVPLPEPGPGELRVQITGCGVCASNLTPWAGADWMHFPTEPGMLGHEAWGVVDKVGPGVAGLAPGDRVATLGERSFAEAERIAADHVVKLPGDMDGIDAVGEAVGCAMNIFSRSGIAAGQWVAIIGIGFLGAILTRLATDAGAQVVAISRRPWSLALARDHGAAETVALDDHRRVVDAVGALAGPHGGCATVIEATGKPWPLDLAGDLVAEGGRLVIAGYHQDGPRRINVQQWNWKGIDVVNAHERALDRRLAGMRAGLAAVAAGRIDLQRLVTHRFPLARLGDALDLTRDRPDGFVKAVVIP